MAGIGSWAVSWSAGLQDTWTLNQAGITANSTALALEMTVVVSMQPALVLALFVRQNPRWADLSRNFHDISSNIFAEVAADSTDLLPLTLRLVPFGVISASNPLPDLGLKFENGTDVFADPLRRGDMTRIAQLNQTSITWFSQSQTSVLYARVPIFIGNCSQTELWGRNNDASMREYCRPCYRPDLHEKLWGFTAVFIDPQYILMIPQLQDLANMKYLYKLYRPASFDDSDEVLIGQTADDVSSADMLMQIVNLPNSQWVLLIIPVGGWNVQWVIGLTTVTIVLSAFVSVLLGMVMISRHDHQKLVNSLIPRGFMERVRRNLADHNKLQPLQSVQGSTPADKILDVMSMFLVGKLPDLRDVVLIRTAILQSFDLHAPIDIEQHIMNAVPDTTEAAALVSLVGNPDGTAGRNAEGCHSVVITKIDCGITSELDAQLSGVSSWDFDVFRLDDVTGGRSLSILALFLLNRRGLIQRFNLPTNQLVTYLETIEDGYRDDNPYHNRKHAAGVLQAMSMILPRMGFVDDISWLACYFAAIIHDYDHGGYTNDFLIRTEAIMAITYNDKSPLENHHLSAAYLKSKVPNMNFMINVDHNDQMTFRKLLIDLVLSTDMKQHFGIVSHFETIQKHRDRGLSSSEDLSSLQMAMKVSDLGHLSSPLSLHLRWVIALEEESFRQGDAEKSYNMSVSPLFDRTKPGLSGSQIGFLDVVVLPCFKAFIDVFPQCNPIMQGVMVNYEYWDRLAKAKHM